MFDDLDVDEAEVVKDLATGVAMMMKMMKMAVMVVMEKMMTMMTIIMIMTMDEDGTGAGRRPT